MVIRKSEQTFKRNGKTYKAIIEYVFDNYVIYAFEGEISELDIYIKYKKDMSRLRTPQHIHWVVDMLLKIQGNKRLSKKFLKQIKLVWTNSKPLSKRTYRTLKALIENDEEMVLDDYSALNKYGEFSIEFLYVLMKLLAVQEKTNRADAYMFGSVIDSLLEDNLDIFKIVSDAGLRGNH